jgi:hypothetical protein
MLNQQKHISLLKWNKNKFNPIDTTLTNINNSIHTFINRKYITNISKIPDNSRHPVERKLAGIVNKTYAQNTIEYHVKKRPTKTEDKEIKFRENHREDNER